MRMLETEETNIALTNVEKMNSLLGFNKISHNHSMWKSTLTGFLTGALSLKGCFAQVCIALYFSLVCLS